MPVVALVVAQVAAVVQAELQVVDVERVALLVQAAMLVVAVVAQVGMSKAMMAVIALQMSGMSSETY